MTSWGSGDEEEEDEARREVAEVKETVKSKVRPICSQMFDVDTRQVGMVVRELLMRPVQDTVWRHVAGRMWRRMHLGYGIPVPEGKGYLR